MFAAEISQPPGRRFSEKIAFGSFTASTQVTYSATIWSSRDVDLTRAFKEGAIVNNLDVDIDVYDPSDLSGPLFSVKASGGSATFSKADLLGLVYPAILINNTAGNASSGNVIMTLIR